MISINTSEYIKTKSVEIDGKKLNLRPMSSAESLELNRLQKEMQAVQGMEDEKEKAGAAMDLIGEIADLYFGLYDDPETARKLLSPLPFEAWFEIYGKVMNGENDG